MRFGSSLFLTLDLSGGHLEQSVQDPELAALNIEAFETLLFKLVVLLHGFPELLDDLRLVLQQTEQSLSLVALELALVIELRVLVLFHGNERLVQRNNVRVRVLNHQFVFCRNALQAKRRSPALTQSRVS